jgi:hypothetical protein
VAVQELELAAELVTDRVAGQAAELVSATDRAMVPEMVAGQMVEVGLHLEE